VISDTTHFQDAASKTSRLNSEEHHFVQNAAAMYATTTVSLLEVNQNSVCLSQR